MPVEKCPRHGIVRDGRASWYCQPEGHGVRIRHTPKSLAAEAGPISARPYPLRPPGSSMLVSCGIGIEWRVKYREGIGAVKRNRSSLSAWSLRRHEFITK